MIIITYQMTLSDFCILLLIFAILYVIVFRKKEPLANKYERLLQRPRLAAFLTGLHTLQGSGPQTQDIINRNLETLKEDIERIPGLANLENAIIDETDNIKDIIAKMKDEFKKPDSSSINELRLLQNIEFAVEEKAKDDEKLKQELIAVEREINDTSKTPLLLNVSRLQEMVKTEFRDDTGKIDNIAESGLIKCTFCELYTPVGLTLCDDPYHSLCFGCFVFNTSRALEEFEKIKEERANLRYRPSENVESWTLNFSIKCPSCNKEAYIPHLMRNLQFLVNNKKCIEDLSTHLKFNGIEPYSLDAASGLNPANIDELRAILHVQNKNPQELKNDIAFNTEQTINKIQERKEQVEAASANSRDINEYINDILTQQPTIPETQEANGLLPEVSDIPQVPNAISREDANLPAYVEEFKLVDDESEIISRDIRLNHRFLKPDSYFKYTEANADLFRMVDASNIRYKQDAAAISNLKTYFNKSLEKLNNMTRRLYGNSPLTTQENQDTLNLLKHMNAINKDMVAIKERSYEPQRSAFDVNSERSLKQILIR